MMSYLPSQDLYHHTIPHVMYGMYRRVTEVNFIFGGHWLLDYMLFCVKGNSVNPLLYVYFYFNTYVFSLYVLNAVLTQL